MDFWAVENGELVLYKRFGECKQCGACCHEKTIVYEMCVGINSGKRDDEDKSEYDWSNDEGWSMFLAQGIWWYFKIPDVKDKPQRCPNLTPDNKCNEWMSDDFRPICRYWPFHPSNIEKFDCGFKFERIEEA